MALTTKLTQLADAIRNKAGLTSQLDLSGMISAVGDLRKPAGSKSITQNGTVDVAAYATAAVSVLQDYTVEDGLIDKTIAGSYTNNRITTKVGKYVFNGCTGLTSVSFPELADIIDYYSFSGCSSLASVNFPKAKRLGEGAFQVCPFTSVSFPCLTTIAPKVFTNCTSLSVFNLYSQDRTEIPILGNANAFTGTPIADGNGYIIINDSLVDSLKAASNWSTYSTQIIGNTAAAQQELI